MAVYSVNSPAIVQNTESQGSLLKGYYKAEDGAFLDIMKQMTVDGSVTISGREYSMTDQPLAAITALNKLMADNDAVRQMLLKIYTAEDKWIDQVVSMRLG